jgi:phosphoribosylaminoimidazole-succinocarboxamide synthase
MPTFIEEATERTLAYVGPYIDGQTPLIDTSISEDALPGFEMKYVGKVRDMYICKNFVVLVATDRQSAFDRQLAAIPWKGQVLNLTSLWWFERTKNIVPNHILGSPHPNVTLCKKCKVFPIEFVMRGYLTGSTSTSIWKNYEKGVRSYCGHNLSDGMTKNQILAKCLLTPTTKDDVHDELISAADVVEKKYMSQEHWDKCAAYSHTLFAFGQEEAAKHGYILVDTKYEFGLDAVTGEVMLVDEVHTPDSSRYWVRESYEERVASGQEPENVDKEVLRKWYASQCDPYKDEFLPTAPLELVNELSRRYIMLFETLLGATFDFGRVSEASSLADAVLEGVSAL